MVNFSQILTNRKHIGHELFMVRLEVGHDFCPREIGFLL